MAIRTEPVSLDIRPCCDARGPVVCGRQGDEGTVVVATVTQGGEPMALDGLTATLLGNNPELLQLVGTVSGSTATFTLPSAFFSASGIVRLYVQLSQGDGVVASTQTFTLRVAPDADLSASQAQGYVPQLDEALATAQQASQTAEAAAAQATHAVDDAKTAVETAKTAVENANAATDAANAAAENANTTVQNANDATDAANAAAENANNAAQTVRTNILTGTLGPAVVASAGDAHPGALMRKVQVLGQTRQNLFPSFRSGSSFGIDYTANEDGSCTISGTSTAQFSRIDLGQLYSLKPGTRYSIVTDGLEDNETYPFVQFYKGGSVVQTSVETSATKSFTSPESFDYAKALINGAGSSGKTNVGELSIVAAGKNIVSGELLQASYSSSIPFIATPKTPVELPFSTTDRIRGVAYMFQVVGGQTYTASCTVNPDFKTFVGWSLYRSKDDATDFKKRIEGSTTTTTTTTNTTTFTPSVSGVLVLGIFGSYAGVALTGTIPEGFAMQLELGSTATVYELPHVTTTPQDLEGHELRSLPDGTCDTLVWNADGTRSIDERCIGITFDGSEDWTYSSSYDAFQLTKPNIPDVDFSVSNVFCDKYSVATGIGSAKDKQFALSTEASSIFVKDSAFGQDASEFKASLASSPMTCVFARNDTTVALAPVPMVEQPSTTLNIWADADDGLSPEVEATYERDLTIAYDNLASKVAALTVAQATN